MTISEHPKIVIAVNKRLEAGPALNAAAHAMLGLSARLGADAARLQVIDYPTADDSGFLASALSLIVLRATPSHLARLRGALLATSLPVVAFHAEMTGGTYEEQVTRSAGRSIAELDLYAVATLGDADEIDPLTRRCSLY